MYVGDGSLIVGGRCPDFMNKNGKKKVIELFGDFWHKNDNPDERIAHFRHFGFDCLVVWEHELKNEEGLRQKILEFNNGAVVKCNGY
jgi:G:T-mismatch repair DNA endonuclease (very short patch repair protein)